MTIRVEELNDTNCKSYLLHSGQSAVLIDPVRERIETYRQSLIERGLQLVGILETHTHADHLSFSREIKDSLGAPLIMHAVSPSPLVDRHIAEGDVVELDGHPITVLHTPGHTPDSVCYRIEGAVLTGDTLLINGSGRTDFPGGDAGAQYDGITQKLFTLPDDTVVWPGHDYRGNRSTTIGAQKKENPRLAGVTREGYVEIMDNLGLPFPTRIQEVLQVNQSGFEPHEVLFPAVADVAAAATVSASELAALLEGDEAPLLLDVREPEEFVGELGHVKGSLLVPLDALQRRLPKLAGYVDRPIAVVCRAGARSASACAILRHAGFARVLNLAGGMLAWTRAELPVQH